MDIAYDQKADAMYIRLSAGEVAETKQLSEDVAVDLDQDGRLLGIEILGVSEKMTPDAIAHVTIRMPLKGAAA